MASFDVKDLFTNVPLQETIEICVELLSDGSGSIMGLPQDLFRTMMELSVFNSVFLFDEKYYKQVDGLGMGLPLSPTLANIFLCHFEEKWLNSCPQEYKPTFFKRYVDDCFLIFRRRSHMQKISIILILNMKI